MQYMHERLREFSRRAEVKISVGIDMYGTSREGLADLLDATPGGEIFVYRNNGPYTFHPKVYLFGSASRADIIVGSGNLTGGGLFTNYEAALAASLDLGIPEDAAFFQSVGAALDAWSRPQEGVCHLLTPEFLIRLVESGLVRGEADLAAMQETRTPGQPESGAPPAEARHAGGVAEAPTAPLFISVPVPPPPPVGTPQARTAGAEITPEAAEAPPAAVIAPPGILPAQAGGPSCFAMILQKTDVSLGQTSKGTSRRSPEVFIPLAALDQNPAFWRFPDRFKPDTKWNKTHPTSRRNGLGKMDRTNVPVRIIGVIQSVWMFFYPRKGDLRLRNEALRGSGKVGDILLIRRVDPQKGFEYDVQVAPQRSPSFHQLQPFCTTPVRNSRKRFGYF